MFEPLEKLPEICRLNESADRYVVRVYRQSGNLYRDDRFFGSRGKALSAAISTLRRSRRNSVVVQDNKLSIFAIQGMHNARGRQEGKKVGRVEIHAIGSDIPEDPSSISASSAPNDQRYKNTKVFSETKAINWNKMLPFAVLCMFIIGFLSF
ncbi:hypothetical protein [Vibrio harveyi]|uniref:hypothetical protein n=1 Tax=Vibrio harveyi TaxID=669 RepID=UPI002380A517|nr:hypothetical protein [Vibrio harveyi]HDM8062559.1 hypothetical protein [Vibrio harveyi]